MRFHCYPLTHKTGWRRSALLVLLLGLLLPLSAQTYTVTNTSSDVNTANSFPWAIDQANNDGAASTINVTATGTVTLTASLGINEALTINGSTDASGMPAFKLQSRGTILSGVGTVSGVSINNLGFTNTLGRSNDSRGIQLTGLSDVSITNCLFESISRTAIEISGGANVSVTNNTFKFSGGQAGGSVVIITDVVSNGGPRLSVSGNTFFRCQNAYSFGGMPFLSVNDSGSPEVLLATGSDGLENTSGSVLSFGNCDNLDLIGLDLTFTDPVGIRGRAIQAVDCDNLVLANLTIANRWDGIVVTDSDTLTVSNNDFNTVTKIPLSVTGGSNATIVNNTFTNSGTATGDFNISIDGVTADDNGTRLYCADNTFSGGKDGVRLSAMDDITIANTGSPEVLLLETDGNKSLRGTLLQLVACANVSLADFDLSYDNGSGGFDTRSIGLQTFNCDNLSVTNFTIDRRDEGLSVTNSETVSLTNNTFTNARSNGIKVVDGSAATVTGNSFTSCGGINGGFNLNFRNVESVGGLRTTVTGNTFSGGANLLNVEEMDGITISESAGAEIVLPISEGKLTVGGTILRLNGCDNVNLSNMTQSYTGSFNTGNGILAFNCDNLTLSDFTINNRMNGIITDNCNTLNVTNNTISDLARTGIRVNGGSAATVLNNTITDHGNSNFSGFALELTNITEANGLRLRAAGNTVNDGRDGVFCSGMDSLRIATQGAAAEVLLPNNDGRSSTTGTSLKIQDCADVTLDSLDFSLVGASTLGTGLSVVNCTNFVVQNTTVSGRLFGMEIQNSLTAAVLNNTFTDCSGRGLAVEGGENYTITGNRFTNCGSGSTNAAINLTGIVADANGKRLSVSANAFANTKSGFYVNNVPGIIVSDSSVVGTEVAITTADQVDVLTSSAVRIENSPGVRIEGLTLEGPGRIGFPLGVFLNECPGSTITNNVLRGWRSGVAVYETVASNSSHTISNNLLERNVYGLEIRLGGNSPTLTATGNNFVCNELAIRADREAVVNAAGNYWGAASGSSTDGGTGDAYEALTSSHVDDASIINTTNFSTTPISGVATATVASIAATGNNTTITDGQTATSATDHTAFGPVSTGTNLTRTYLLINAGLDSLTIDDITISGDAAFTIGSGAPTMIPAGDTVTFTVVFAPTTAAATTATVIIESDACQASLTDFTFDVAGSGASSCAVSIVSVTATDQVCPNGFGSIEVIATGGSTLNYLIIDYEERDYENQTGVFNDLPPGGYYIQVSHPDDANCSANQFDVIVGAGTDTITPTIDGGCPATVSATLNLCGELEVTAEALGLTATDDCLSPGDIDFAFDVAQITSATTTNVTVTVSDGINSDNSCVIAVTTVANPEVFTITAGADDLGNGCIDQPIVITAASLLANDFSSDNRDIEVQDVFLVDESQGSITYVNDSTFTFTPNAGVTGTVNLTYLVKAEGDELYSEATGNYYEYVAARNIGWNDAKAAAEARTRNGQQGYLVTITSQEEQDFVNMRLRGFGWTGGREFPEEGSNKWFWVTGPEGLNGGTQFSGSGTPAGAFENWRALEPNNSYDSIPEAYVHLRGDGTWNDYPETITEEQRTAVEGIDGYVVEYGNGVCQPNFTATGNITLTLADNEDPELVNCPASYDANLGANAAATVTIADLGVTATDNCATNLVPTFAANSVTSFGCGDLGNATMLTVEVSDGTNSASCDVTINVTDNNSTCVSCDIAFTTEDAINNIPPAIVTNRIVCGDDGAITANATCAGCANGNADIRYSIDGIIFQAGNTFTGLAEGTYTVTIRDVDNNSCLATTTAVVGDCVGEIPGTVSDDDCDGSTDDNAGNVSWILLDNNTDSGGDDCVSITDCCAATFCYGLEYTPEVTGTLTSYTTGFLSTCTDGSTPLLSNASCVMDDNSFDASDCNNDAIFFNSSGNNGSLELTKNVPVILHQICVTVPAETTIDIVKDDITDITMSIDVAPIVSTGSAIVATDRPAYTTFTASGNQRPELTASGTIDDCYETVADAETAAIAASSATDDCTSASAPVLTAATVGTCNAVITVTATDQCGLTSTITFNTTIDGEGPDITGDLPAVYEGCELADVPVMTSVAEMEAEASGTLMVSDSCTADADLVVSLVSEVEANTCPINVTRVYRITDECGRASEYTHTFTINDTTAPTVSGSLTAATVEGCDATTAPVAVTDISALLALAGDLDFADACTQAANLTLVGHADVAAAGSCPTNLVITRTYTVADACGNETTVDHVINVTDTTNPELTAGTLAASCYADRDAAHQAAIDATTATDNCSGDVTLTATSTGTCPATITVTGVDPCGNDTTVTYTVVITDSAVPTELNGPALTATTVQTTLDVVIPTPPSFLSVCGDTLIGTNMQIDDQYTEGDCSGTIEYSWTYTDCAGTETTWSFTYNIECEGLELKLFTEGAFNATSGMLNTTLNDLGMLPGEVPTIGFTTAAPFGHPYQGAPWNYTANLGDAFGDAAATGAPASVTAYPAHVVDWVLVTVREDGTAPADNVWQCTGWLHETGEVTFPEACPITLTSGNTYYVVIEHRSHLPVMSQVTLMGGADHLKWNFTTQNSFAPTFRFGQKEMGAAGSGVWGMFGGNAEQANGRNSINSADRTDWRFYQNFRGYNLGDFDHDGATGSADETLWKNNQNKTSGIRF